MKRAERDGDESETPFGFSLAADSEKAMPESDADDSLARDLRMSLELFDFFEQDDVGYVWGIDGSCIKRQRIEPEITPEELLGLDLGAVPETVPQLEFPWTESSDLWDDEELARLFAEDSSLDPIWFDMEDEFGLIEPIPIPQPEFKVPAPVDREEWKARRSVRLEEMAAARTATVQSIERIRVEPIPPTMVGSIGKVTFSTAMRIE